MNAKLVSFRRGRRTQRVNQLLVSIEGIDSKEKASKLVGRKVIWTTPGGRKIHGKVTAPHGSRGVVRARFSKGLPGQAIAQKVELLE